MSLNLSSKTSPKSIQGLEKNLGHSKDALLDGGRAASPVGILSLLKTPNRGET
jgi:hypothetical protein